MNELQNYYEQHSGGGLFVSRSAAEWIASASVRPAPRRLWHDFWFEDEACCLFADTNVGKSIYAVQIGDSLARQGFHVLYFDFELSDKQFQMRYTDPATADTGEPLRLHDFPPSLTRVELGSSRSLPPMAEMIDAIACEVERQHARIIIIDNLTWLCNSAESADMAGLFMQELTRLKREYKLSILVLAHTPKRAGNAPLTVNSLAGSKRLSNFFDSIFALGVDHTNLPAGRYIKQIKVRSAEMRYGDGSVMQAELCREGAFLHIRPTGSYPPEQLLLETDGADDDETRERILRSRRQGMSLRAIASAEGLSLSKVQRIVARQ